MPETDKLANATGCLCRVLAKGPLADEVKVGDVVHLKAYGTWPAGKPFVHEGQNVILIRQRDINGVVLNYKPEPGDEPWAPRADWDRSSPAHNDLPLPGEE